MLQIEKWVTFLILAFILLIAVFNVASSLYADCGKEEDIRSFRNMGASDQLISRIFLYEGWLIAFWGIIVGIAVGLILCLIQQHFGLLRLGDTPGAYIVEAYPVVVKATDILIVFVSVSIIGFLAILYPIRNLKKYLKNDRIL